MRTLYEKKIHTKKFSENFVEFLFGRIFFSWNLFKFMKIRVSSKFKLFFFVETFWQKFSEVPETLKENSLIKRNVKKIGFFYSYVSEHTASLGSKTQFGYFWGRKVRVNCKGIRQVVLWESPRTTSKASLSSS